MNTAPGYQHSNSMQGRGNILRASTVIDGRTVIVHVTCYTCGTKGTAEFERRPDNGPMPAYADGCRQLVINDHADCTA